jgi:hypothetical protein
MNDARKAREKRYRKESGDVVTKARRAARGYVEVDPEHGGPTTCLCCGNEFTSWDRRRNRICPACTAGDRRTAAHAGHACASGNHRNHRNDQ